MKKLLLLISLTQLISLSAHAQLFGIGGDREPKELENLKKSPAPVPRYERFEQIPSTTPVPGAFRLRVGTLIRMAVLRKQELRYDILEPKDYNQLEKTINSFFKLKSADHSLKLLMYARQLNADHAYKVNSFVPYFTIRSENRLIGDEKTGPAAVVADIFKQRGRIEGEINYVLANGTHKKADVRYREGSLPQTGLLFLFDHDVFPINDMIANPAENVLQDIILHEFTHIWHNELLNSKNKDRNTVGNNMTSNGHDAQIVTNDVLGFSEGLAIGFEALFGSKASQLINMSANERRQFFGRFSGKVRESLEFLINRQTYVRRNSYLYNLYDFGQCTLRVIKSGDSRDIGNVESMIAAIQRGEEVNMEALLTMIDFRTFDRRFYGGERASTVNLMNDCSHDSPARLEAKEGFLATLIYNIVYSGSLMDAQDLEFGRLGQSGKEFSQNFKNYIAQSEAWSEGPRRDLASENERVQRAERVFLLSFRNLVMAIKRGQAITTKEFLDALISERSLFDQDVKLKVAYQVMKVTKGLWFEPRNEMEKSSVELFQTPASINRNAEAIYQFLVGLSDQDRLSDVYSKLAKTPEIYVSFPSGFSGNRNRRININLAYHIDLIDMFKGNNAAITSLARRLDKGETFSSANEFLEFAQSIQKKAQAQKWLEDARKEIASVKNLPNSFMIRDLRNRHLDNE